MAISSILFDFGTVTLLRTFGNCRHPLLQSSVLSAPCRSSLQS
jgi:hypothetical protein